MAANIVHPVAIPADPNTRVWKYFRRKYFIDLIDTQSLFFRRILDFSKQDDPYEGSIPCVDRKRARMHALADPRLNVTRLKTNVELAESVEITGILHTTVINSWTINELEADHMWRIYASASRNRYGVAIWTTVGQLHKAIESAKEEVFGTRIRYIDYRRDSFNKPGEYEHGLDNVMVPCVHKHAQGYTDEKEYRLLHTYRGQGPYKPDELWTVYGNCRGHKIRVDLNTLISGVVLSPFATEKNRQQVERKCRRAKVFAPVQHSHRSPLRDCE